MNTTYDDYMKSEDDKMYDQPIAEPTDKDLIEFIVDEQLNVFQFPNQDCTDMDEEILDPKTYFMDNYDEVLTQWYDKQN